MATLIGSGTNFDVVWSTLIFGVIGHVLIWTMDYVSVGLGWVGWGGVRLGWVGLGWAYCVYLRSHQVFCICNIILYITMCLTMSVWFEINLLLLSTLRN